LSNVFEEKDLTAVIRALDYLAKARKVLEDSDEGSVVGGKLTTFSKGIVMDLQECRSFVRERNVVGIGSVEQDLRNQLSDYWQSHPVRASFERLDSINNSPETMARIVGLIQFSRCRTVSGLWQYALDSPVNGKVNRWKRGEKRRYNPFLRPLVWSQVLRLIGEDKAYAGYYQRCKESIEFKLAKKGIKVVLAKDLPVDALTVKHYEPEGTISRGHVNSRAMRKTAKMFLAHMLIVWWRESGTEPIGDPMIAKYKEMYDPGRYLK
jgi:hypothetical protein